MGSCHGTEKVRGVVSGPGGGVRPPHGPYGPSPDSKVPWPLFITDHVLHGPGPLADRAHLQVVLAPAPGIGVEVILSGGADLILVGADMILVGADMVCAEITVRVVHIEVKVLHFFRIDLVDKMWCLQPVWPRDA